MSTTNNKGFAYVYPSEEPAKKMLTQSQALTLPPVYNTNSTNGVGDTVVSGQPAITSIGRPLVSQVGVAQKTFDAVDGGFYNYMPTQPLPKTQPNPGFTTPLTQPTNTQPKKYVPPQFESGEVGPDYNRLKELVSTYKQNQIFPTSTNPILSKIQKQMIQAQQNPNQNYFQKAQAQAMAFNKGGSTMEQQMSLFDEGGMKDDGLSRDPISGNEIPPGSTAKEVRDDIPAQLSEGEYVVPADVVQYYGVKFFEDLRAEAKRGLAEMERTGRIGGEPVEVDMTMIAFGKPEDKKKAQGGVIKANEGVLATANQVNQSATYNPYDDAVLGMGPSSALGQVSTGQPEATGKNNIQKIMYYHGQTGEAKEVTFIDGVVTPIEDTKFTQPPWSINKPSPMQKEEREDKSSNQQPPKIDSWGMNPEVYNFGSWDRDRFIKEAESQLKISMGERLISGMATMVNPLVGAVVTGMATGDGFAKTKVMINALNKAGDEETADILEDMYSKAKDNLPGLQGWIMNTEIAEKGINASATLISDQISKMNPSFANFASSNSLNLSSSSSNISSNNISSSNIDSSGISLPYAMTMQPTSSGTEFGEGVGSNTVLATPDSENVQNFGGRDVDVDATLANFGMGNNATNTTDDVSETDSAPTKDEDEENLSKAYGGGEASKKFAMKKGGLATKRKRRNKK